MQYRLSLIIPVFNEVGNIAPLCEDIAHQRKRTNLPFELIFVNNGSEDDSEIELVQATHDKDWIRVLKLEKNRGYGGGIQFGWQHHSSEATHVGWMPADRQYSIGDLEKIWKQVTKKPIAIHKGVRTQRYDGWQTQLVSKVYSKMVQKLLSIHATDINGLPKIFPTTFLSKLNFPLANSFHLDAQILLAAKMVGLPVIEHPVTFYDRRAGTSSWSSQRIKVYCETFSALLRYKRESSEWGTSS